VRERQTQNEKKKRERVEQCPRHPKKGEQLDKGKVQYVSVNLVPSVDANRAESYLIE
jgi:hypothetical protein